MNVTERLLEDVRITIFLEDVAVNSTWYTCGSRLAGLTVHPTRAVKEVICSIRTFSGIPGETVNGVPTIISF